jgi:hypothetical protein
MIPAGGLLAAAALGFGETDGGGTPSVAGWRPCMEGSVECLWGHPSRKYRQWLHAVAGDYEGAVAADFSRQLLALRARF